MSLALANWRAAALVPLCAAAIAMAPHAAPPQEATAEARALEFQRNGRHDLALPYFREAAKLHSEESTVHVELSQALFNASSQTDLSLGFVRFVVPSSQERSQLLADAVSDGLTAIAKAQTPEQRAFAHFNLGRIWLLSGQFTEALLQFEVARSLVAGIEVLEIERAKAEGLLRVQ